MSIAKSKIVECPDCGLKFYARGLHPHRRQKHGLPVNMDNNIKVLNKIEQSRPNELPADLKPTGDETEATNASSYFDPLHTRNYVKDAFIAHCYRCQRPIELKMPDPPNFAYGKKFVCERCIREFYDQPGCIVRAGKYDAYGDHLIIR